MGAGRPVGGSLDLRGPILAAADRAVEESADGRIRVPTLAKELGLSAAVVRYHLYASGMRDACRRAPRPKVRSERRPPGPPVPILPLGVIWARAEEVRMPEKRREPARRPRWTPLLGPAEACRIMLDEWRAMRRRDAKGLQGRPDDGGTPGVVAPGCREGEGDEAEAVPPAE